MLAVYAFSALFSEIRVFIEAGGEPGVDIWVVEAVGVVDDGCLYLGEGACLEIKLRVAVKCIKNREHVLYLRCFLYLF